MLERNIRNEILNWTTDREYNMKDLLREVQLNICDSLRCRPLRVGREGGGWIERERECINASYNGVIGNSNLTRWMVFNFRLKLKPSIHSIVSSISKLQPDTIP